jgi:hypothetical protein
LRPRATQDFAFVQSSARFHHAGPWSGLTPRTDPRRREPSGPPFASSYAWIRF